MYPGHMRIKNVAEATQCPVCKQVVTLTCFGLIPVHHARKGVVKNRCIGSSYTPEEAEKLHARR